MTHANIHVTAIPFESIAFKESDEQVRRDCHQPYAGHDGGCPNFGKTYGCPPHAPDLETFKARLAEHAFFYLVHAEVALGPDATQEKPAYATIHLLVDAFMEFLQDKMQDLFIIHGYGCHYCERVNEGRCTCPDAPCRHPDKRTYSLSVALDIVSTMNAAGIPMEKNPLTGSKVFRRIAFVASKSPVNMEGLVKEFESD